MPLLGFALREEFDVQLRRVINGPKTVTNWGVWKAGIKMPRSVFPLSKNQFKIPKAYSWCVVEFDSQGDSYKLLVAYRVDLQRYQCLLGKVVLDDTIVLARYEYHANEPGWHMHCVCDDAGQVPGTIKCSEKRLPAWSAFHKGKEFGTMDNRLALERAKRIFKLGKMPPAPLFA